MFIFLDKRRLRRIKKQQYCPVPHSSSEIGGCLFFPKAKSLLLLLFMWGNKHALLHLPYYDSANIPEGPLSGLCQQPLYAHQDTSLQAQGGCLQPIAATNGCKETRSDPLFIAYSYYFTYLFFFSPLSLFSAFQSDWYK